LLHKVVLAKDPILQAWHTLPMTCVIFLTGICSWHKLTSTYSFWRAKSF